MKTKPLNNDSVTISAVGADYTFKPVPLSRLPSRNPADWAVFCGVFLDGLMGTRQVERLQAFMSLHNTEAVTDGISTFTLAGNSLMYCNAKPFQVKAVLATPSVFTGQQDYSF